MTSWLLDESTTSVEAPPRNGYRGYREGAFELRNGDGPTGETMEGYLARFNE